MRTTSRILIAGLLACTFFAPAAAQSDGMKVGFGADLRNQPVLIVVDTEQGVPALGGMISHTRLTPSLLLSVRATPNVFIEPSFGYHRTTGKTEVGGVLFTDTEENTASHLLLGIGMIFVANPNAFVSPMLHPTFDLHFLNATSESTDSGGSEKIESSVMAFSIGLGGGGMVNIKDLVFMTVEARIAFHAAGDVDVKVTPADGFEDNTDTSASTLTTDMAIGLRVVF